MPPLIRFPTVLFAIFLGAAPAVGRSARPVDGHGFVTIHGRELIGPDGKVLHLRGINLGGWLVPEGYMFGFSKAAAPWQIRQVFKELVGSEADNAFWRRWYDSFITRDDIRYIRATGMNVVRIPFDYRLFTPEEDPDTWVGIGFKLLDRVIEWCAEAGIYVLLDMHAAPCGQSGTNTDNSYGYPQLFDDLACQSRTVAVWRRTARRYAHNRHVIGYDLLNEPIPKNEEYARLKPKLERVYKEIVAAVRQVDTRHLIFLSGAEWGYDFSVFNDVHFDPKLVYTFHAYWTEPNERVFAQHLEFSKINNVPIFLGESGENTDAWIGDFRRALEANDIGWAFWTYKRMDTQSSMRTFDKPAYWDELVTYQQMPSDPFAKSKKARPSQEHVRAALNGLARNARFENTRENSTYIQALGMHPRKAP